MTSIAASRVTVLALLVCGIAAWTERPAAIQGGSPAERPTVAIGGRVLDPDRRPVAAALVAIVDDRKLNRATCPTGFSDASCFEQLTAAGGVRASTRSDPSGQFVLQLPGGLTNVDHIWARGEDAQGRPLQISWLIRLNRPNATTALGDILLNRRRDFVVIVQDASGPIANADVDFGNGQKRLTDRTGSATYSMYAPAESESSTYHLAFTIRATGYAGQGWAGGHPAGTTTQVITLVRETPQPGRVLDAAGLGVAGAVLSARPAKVSAIGIATSHSTPPDQTYGVTRTDADGRFVLPGLHGGAPYIVKVAAGAGAADIERVVTVTGTPIDIPLALASSVTLSISGLPDDVLMRRNELRPSQPGPGISLEWLDVATGAWQSVSTERRVVWGDGDRAELHFDRVPAGSVRVLIDGSFGVARDLLQPFVVAGGEPIVVPVRLVASRELRLRVTDQRGAPVAGARVEVFSHTGRSSSYTDSGPDGAVTFRVHPDHPLKLTVSVGGKIVLTTTMKGDSPGTVSLVTPQ